MKKNTHNPTMMIKSKFSNAVHKILEPNIDIKKSNRWKYNLLYKFTNEQKIEMFDKILKLHNESSEELTNYQYERREKKRVHNDRVKRGYYEKNNKKIV